MAVNKLSNSTEDLEKQELDFYQQSERTINNILKISSTHLSVGQETQIKTNSIHLNFKRSSGETLNRNMTTDQGEIKTPSLCDNILSGSDSCSTKIITQQVFLKI